LVTTLPLAKNQKQWFYLVITLFFIFIVNTLYEYKKFQDFKYDEIYVTNAKVINIYEKKHYQILKLQTSSFTFFTSNHTKVNLKQQEFINIYLNTTKVTFIEFLKGFYTTSFNIQKLKTTPSLVNSLSSNVNEQHSNTNISSLFNALFFAISINQELRELCAIFGVSHLIAISGFHLGILSFVIYWILYLPYSKLQEKYFPYRNKKFDLLLITSFLLLLYLLLTNIVPSLLRSFVMFIFGIFFLRTNIKILSFGTLALVVMFIIAFFPKLLFSISLWFSVAGVFYIFLFIKYFKNMNKIIAFLFFNLWIYLAINPITHFFFGTTSLVQLYSPLFTIGFTIFYPIELFLHLIKLGGTFDGFIELWLNLKPNSKDIFTPTWIFVSYIVLSFLSIAYKKWFIILNLSLISFNSWLYFLVL
jgi:competence protein ComEC